MKLDIGGGQIHREGFTNIDLCCDADIKHDLTKPLPFEDNSIEEILAVHVIESFYKWQLPDVLKDWYRVLNGKMTIEFTDLDDTIKLYLSENEDEHIRGYWGLYGNQDIEIDPIVLHHYVWKKDNLIKLLKEIGFKNIELTKDNVEHYQKRDYRIVCFT